MNIMCFTGRVAAAPELRKASATDVCKFTLMRNEYAGRERDDTTAKERVVSLPLTAFGTRAEAIARHVRKGDQLVVTARIENNRYTDGGGIERYDYNFIVEDFEFGAPGEEKRRELDQRRTEHA